MPSISTTSLSSKNRLRSTVFKYYIHDSVEVCRFELIGELTEADLVELQGCWRTARTILGARKLVFDLLGLKSTDEIAKQWLTGMAAEGATYLPASFLRTGLQPQPAREPIRLGWFGKLVSLFRGSRVLSAESSTQAQ